jgi:hypothetical protein
MNIFLNPTEKGFPLRPGFDLLIGGIDETPDPKLRFRIALALHELGIVNGAGSNHCSKPLSNLRLWSKM